MTLTHYDRRSCSCCCSCVRPDAATGVSHPDPAVITSDDAAPAPKPLTPQAECGGAGDTAPCDDGGVWAVCSLYGAEGGECASG